MPVPYTLTSSSITLYLDGKPQTVDASSPTFNDLKEALRNQADDDTLRNLVSTRKLVERKSFGRVQVVGDAVYYDDMEMQGHLVDRMLSMMKEGFDISPLARFMARLMHNPSTRAVDELFIWLEQSQMPITADGHFLAYKKVRNDYLDYFSRSMSNAVGNVLEMDRTEVDPDRNRTCSAGLHFCSYSYLPSYFGSEGRVMVVKIDPADVVAIPSDYNNAKGRTWRYAVIGEVDEHEASFAFENTSVVTSYGTYDDGDDDDLDLEDEDEDLYPFDDPYSDDGDDEEEEDDDEYEDDVLNAVVALADDEDEDGGETEVLFHHVPTGYMTSAEDLMKLLVTHGQRGASRMTGVPRTTLQEWVKRIYS